MKHRCYSPKNKQFKDYGGRGICVCPQWLNDVHAFLDYVGNRPSKLHSLDRIDNNRGYEPGNVRWATRKEQQNNMRSNARVTCPHTGRTLTLSQWGDELGIRPFTLYRRLSKHGWTVEEALTTPAGVWLRRNRTTPNVSPETNLSALAREAGLKPTTVHYRLKLGWTLERALSTPARPMKKKGTP